MSRRCPKDTKMRVAAWLLLVVVATACGQQSMLGTELDRKLVEVDRAVTRSEVEVACAKLPEVSQDFTEWAEGARGERAARANQAVERLSGLNLVCAHAASGDLGMLWPPVYQEIRAI